MEKSLWLLFILSLNRQSEQNVSYKNALQLQLILSRCFNPDTPTLSPLFSRSIWSHAGMGIVESCLCKLPHAQETLKFLHALLYKRLQTLKYTHLSESTAAPTTMTDKATPHSQNSVSWLIFGNSDLNPLPQQRTARSSTSKSSSLLSGFQVSLNLPVSFTCCGWSSLFFLVRLGWECSVPLHVHYLLWVVTDYTATRVTPVVILRKRNLVYRSGLAHLL